MERVTDDAPAPDPVEQSVTIVDHTDEDRELIIHTDGCLIRWTDICKDAELLPALFADAARFQRQALEDPDRLHDPIVQYITLAQGTVVVAFGQYVRMTEGILASTQSFMALQGQLAAVQQGVAIRSLNDASGLLVPGGGAGGPTPPGMGGTRRPGG